jgi:hypothetical protein
MKRADEKRHDLFVLPPVVTSSDRR